MSHSPSLCLSLSLPLSCFCLVFVIISFLFNLCSLFPCIRSHGLNLEKSGICLLRCCTAGNFVARVPAVLFRQYTQSALEDNASLFDTLKHALSRPESSKTVRVSPSLEACISHSVQPNQIGPVFGGMLGYRSTRFNAMSCLAATDRQLLSCFTRHSACLPVCLDSARMCVYLKKKKMFVFIFFVRVTDLFSGVCVREQAFKQRKGKQC